MEQRNKAGESKGKLDIKGVGINTLLFFALLISVIILSINFIIHFDKFTLVEFVSFAIVVISGISISVILFVQHGRDNMTKIPNQTRFASFAFLKMVTRKFPQYAVAFINLKDLKYINRIGGKGNGDYIVCQYAQALKKFTVKGEFVARLGGDNFIMMLYRHRVDELLTFLSGTKINYRIDKKEHELIIQARAGLYSLGSKDTVEDVFGQPAIALGYARAAMEDYAWFSHDMAQKLDIEKSITRSFDEALAAGEFVVYYQPKVDITTNRMYGAEALVRWIRNGEMIPPMSFVPVLEQNRLIHRLDFYVLTQVCKDMIRWKEQGYDLKPISVNFSKNHLKNEMFARNIIDTITSYNLDKALFEVELTETADCHDMEVLFKVVNEIHKAGIKTSIDDFGKGYSTLDVLKNADVDIIKLDKSFVDGIDVNGGQNQDAALVKNIICTCRELKKTVVCEGVESRWQKQIIEKMQCKYIQGYLFDKPMEEKLFTERLADPEYK